MESNLGANLRDVFAGQIYSNSYLARAEKFKSSLDGAYFNKSVQKNEKEENKLINQKGSASGCEIELCPLEHKENVIALQEQKINPVECYYSDAPKVDPKAVNLFLYFTSVLIHHEEPFSSDLCRKFIFSYRNFDTEMHKVFGYLPQSRVKNVNRVGEIVTTRLMSFFRELVSEKGMRHFSQSELQSSFVELIVRFAENGFKDFSYLDLGGLDLSNREFVGCNFRGANFTGANLTNTRLINCFLSFCNFHDATLSGCNVEKSNLRHARFDSQLRASELRGIPFYQIDVDGCFALHTKHPIRYQHVYSIKNALSKMTLKEHNAICVEYQTWRAFKKAGVIVECPILQDTVPLMNACVIKYSESLIRVYDADALWTYLLSNETKDICPLTNQLKNLNFLSFDVFYELIKNEQRK